MGDGSYYEGEFDKGEINGHGMRYYAATRNFYCGEFTAGELDGQGVMRYADGSTYEGSWTDNKREGPHFLQWLSLEHNSNVSVVYSLLSACGTSSVLVVFLSNKILLLATSQTLE